MKNYYLSVILLIPILLMSQVPDFEDTYLYPITSKASFSDLVVDSDDFLYNIGQFRDSVNFGGLTHYGTFDPPSGWGSSIYYRTNSFVCKSDFEQNVYWSKVFHSNDGETNLSAIDMDEDGNIYIAGFYKNDITIESTSLSLPSGSYGVVIIKLDNLGNLIWVKEMIGSNHSGINDIEYKNGSLAFAGYFTGELNYDGTQITSSGTNDLLVGKIDVDGNILWINQEGGDYGGTCGLISNDNALGLTVDNDNNIVITGNYLYNGEFGGTNIVSKDIVDGFVAKYEEDGTFLWVTSFGGNGMDLGVSIDNDSNNNYFVLGRYEGNSIIGLEEFESNNNPGGLHRDLCIFKLDENGSVLWAKSEGGLESEWPSDLVVDYNNDLFISGIYSGDTDFDGQIFSCIGNNRIFVAKYNNNGDLKYVKSAGSFTQRPSGMCINTQNELVLSGVLSPGSTKPDADFSNFVENISTPHCFHTKLSNPITGVGLTAPSDQISMSFYPNPSNGLIRFNLVSEEAIHIGLIQVYNVLGNVVAEFNADLDKQIIDLRHLSLNGAYFLVFRNENNEVIQKKKIRMK